LARLGTFVARLPNSNRVTPPFAPFSVAGYISAWAGALTQNKHDTNMAAASVKIFDISDVEPVSNTGCFFFFLSLGFINGVSLPKLRINSRYFVTTACELRPG